jgi:hypothetical protein
MLTASVKIYVVLICDTALRSVLIVQLVFADEHV